MILKQPAGHSYRLWMKTWHKSCRYVWVSSSRKLWQGKLTLFIWNLLASPMSSLDCMAYQSKGSATQTYIRVHLCHPPACRTIPPLCWLWPLLFSCRRCRAASCPSPGPPLSLMELQHILQNKNQLGKKHGGKVSKDMREKHGGCSYPHTSSPMENPLIHYQHPLPLFLLWDINNAS